MDSDSKTLVGLGSTVVDISQLDPSILAQPHPGSSWHSLSHAVAK